ncbi:DUF1707 SHOCT-like domain-containing protein [Saccharomonospora cyanea]|uniref:DUF1707 domain-containing protein n=1 Tax=Saccharomonospora cyanea NA-134 TaxID=882082 RepID=H5XLC0_9PSEU|nr:protein of unknown function (DUF1707)/predicted membrane protein (DUF2154) [Saccharomonospora cyanea NA-134]
MNEERAENGRPNTDDGVTEEQRRLRGLRVSDTEREHVVELLKTAIGRGMLDLDEFSERADVAYAARTRGELNDVLIDLPGLVHPDAVPAFGTVGGPAVAPTPYAAATVATGEPLVVRAHGSTLVRRGHWVVPSSLVVRNRYADTRLDFTQAQVTSDVVRIELDVKWGGVTIVVPEHAGIDLNELHDIKWSAVGDKTRGNAGSPRYVVTGRLHGGSLSVRYPRKGLFS